jgi:hypothetical protein
LELYPPFQAALKLLPKKPLTSGANGAIIDSGNKLNSDEDDTEFITVNGAAVPIDGGELKGAVGEKIETESVGEDIMKDFDKINAAVKTLIDKGVVNPNIGTAKEPVPMRIASTNKHSLKHGVKLEEAQSFIDNAVVMFDQGNRSLFMSDGGNAVLLDEERRLISAYRKSDFDPGTLAVLEVVNNGS